MTDKIDVFLGDIKCALQRFEPKPGDVFVMTIDGNISFEEETRIWRRWKEHIPYDLKIACLAGETTFEIKLADD